MNQRDLLAGTDIAVARVESPSDRFVPLLRSSGASASLFNVLRVDAGQTDDLDQALKKANHFDWLVLTSANTVRVIEERFQVSPDTFDLSPRIAAVGRTTSAALARLGRRADIVPIMENAEALSELLTSNSSAPGSQSVLLPQSELADPSFADTLRSAGFQVTVVTAYTLRPITSQIDDLIGRITSSALDAILFTSGSAIRAMAPQTASTANWPAVVVLGLAAQNVAQEFRIPSTITPSLDDQTIVQTFRQLLLPSDGTSAKP